MTCGHCRYAPPNLILTVTGGAQHFDLQPHLVKLVREGLEVAVKKTNAWIITGGLVGGWLGAGRETERMGGRHVTVARQPRLLSALART